jgi:hypothetical protein
VVVCDESSASLGKNVSSESKKSREPEIAPFAQRVSGNFRKKRHQNGVSSQLIWMHDFDQDKDESLKRDGKNLTPIDEMQALLQVFSQLHRRNLRMTMSNQLHYYQCKLIANLNKN